MSEKKVTMKDIADFTHFSKTTISRYFNRPESVSTENREKIAEALRVLNYKENKVARILARGKTEFIGLLVPNLFLSYYGEVMDSFLRSYQRYGYKFIVFAGSDSEETERKYIEELMAYQIEGLIVLTHTMSSEELASLPVPVVGLEREDKYIDSVNTDNYLGGMQAARHLADLGCDILIHFNSDARPEIPASRRIAGFTDYCLEQHLPYELLIEPYDNTYAHMKSVICRTANQVIEKYPGLRKGIFVSNDSAASILLNHLVSRFGGLPEEFLIVGFDNTRISQESIIPISTVGQQIDIMTDTAMQLLIAQIQGRTEKAGTAAAAPVHKIIPPILIPRATSMPEVAQKTE